MSGLWGLVLNENMKIYRRIRTWIFAAALLLLIIGGAVLTLKFEPEYSGSEWRSHVQQEIDSVEKDLAQGDMPKDMTTMMQQEIGRNQYYLDHNINPYEKNEWTFLKDNLLLVSIISLFVVIVASDIVASEFTWGTVKMLLIRPFSREQILLSKFLAVMIFQLVLYIEFFVVSYLVGGIVFGFGGLDYIDQTFGMDGTLSDTVVSDLVLKTLGLGFLSLIVIVGISFMISTVFRSSSLAIGIGIVTLFAGNIINVLLQKYEWTKYLLFPNLELTWYMNDQPPLIEGMSLQFSLIVDAIYLVIILIFTWFLFKKRDVAA